MRRRASAADVSVGGLGLSVNALGLVVGESVIAEFPLPGIGLPLELDARVVWSGTQRVGLRFESLDPGLRELLESYVEGRLHG